MTPSPLLAVGETVLTGFDRWGEFLLLVLVLLAFDLFVVHRKAHAVTLREAAGWSVFWVAVGLAFNGWVWWEYGHEAASLFFQAYITEKALSIDNLFIFLVIFGFFRVDPRYRHRVLFLGILGALVMRGLFIFLGVEIIHRFEPALYAFGAILLYTAWKLLRDTGEEFRPEESLVYRAACRILPLHPGYDEGRFLVRREGRILGTTLLLVVFVVEGSDVVFAVDSVPACIGITRDPFLVYTSNVFALLGLRALYFLVEGGLKTLPGLHVGLALVLAFVGVKIMLEPEPIGFHMDTRLSLGILVGLLAGSCGAAMAARRLRGAPGGEVPPDSPR